MAAWELVAAVALRLGWVAALVLLSLLVFGTVIFLYSLAGLAAPLQMTPHSSENDKRSQRYTCLSFAGGGIMSMCYYMGVVRVLMHRKDLHGCHFTGSSCGIHAAVLLLYLQGLPSFEEREDAWKNYSTKTVAWLDDFRPGWFLKLYTLLPGALKVFFQLVPLSDDLLVKCQGRLHIPVTQISLLPPRYQTIVYSQFRDTTHLKEIIRTELV